MARGPVPLESWEAVLPGVVFPLIALALGGDGWAARGVAASTNLVPLAALALLTWMAGRRTPAVQGGAAVAYGIAAAGWVGSVWDVPGLQRAGEHAALWTPLVAAAAGAMVFLFVFLVGPAPDARSVSPSEEV